MKTRRQQLILEIISKKDIETQNQLMDELGKHGMKSTQATVSRDIKELRLSKELSPAGRYRYIAAGRVDSLDHNQRLRKIFREGVTSVEAAQNIIVIRTLPGLASAAGSNMDSLDYPDLLGTLAGDDTVMVVMRDGKAAERLCADIGEMLKA